MSKQDLLKTADHVVLVANAPEGAQVVKSRSKIGWTVPIVSHWGISGGRFADEVDVCVAALDGDRPPPGCPNPRASRGAGHP